VKINPVLAEPKTPFTAHGSPRWRYLPAACGGPHKRAGGCPKEVVTLRESHDAAGSWQDLWTHGERGAHAGAGLLAGLVTLWGTHAGAVVPEGLLPVRRTHSGAVSEELQLVGSTHVREVHRGLSPMGGTSHWSRQRV